MNNVELRDSYMRSCFSHEVITSHILFHLDSSAKKISILVCKNWNHIINCQILSERTKEMQEIMEKLYCIFLANDHENLGQQVLSCLNNSRIFDKELKA